MKVKHILVLFLLTYVVMGLGTLFNIQHWPGGSLLLIVSGLMKFVATILAIWKILTIDKFKEFLDS